MYEIDEQANLSDRERAIRTKEKLRLLGFNSPVTAAMWGLKPNQYTTFYYSTRERRSNHAIKLRAEYGESIKIEFINPKKR